MDNSSPTLTMREYPFGLWSVAFLIGGLGAYYFFTTPVQRVMSAIMLGIGLIILLTSSVFTLHADRLKGTITLSHRAVLRSSRKEIPIAEVSAVQLERSRSSSSSGPAYRIVLVCKGGQTLPFHSYYSSGVRLKQRRIERLRSFLGVGGTDERTGGLFQLASQMAQPIFQEQQEALTGPEAEEHVKDGIHWQVQTRAFGGTGVTRWFSPDFKMVNGFLFLAQKVAGQKTMGGGLLAGFGKMLFQQSINLYGFSAEDTPGMQAAEVLTPLDPQLEPHFSAFTSDPGAARQILNPWAAAPLADWGGRYPLKQFQPAGHVFGQLSVLFSPRGVTLATTGLLIPEALDELTNLGVELVKAQVGTPSRVA